MSLFRFICLSSLLLPASALAFNPQPDPPGFGLHAITTNQEARLAVVNVGSTSCTVMLRMLDADGDAIASQSATIEPGTTGAMIVVGGRDLVPAGAYRGWLRPAVGGVDNPDYLPPAHCVATFSIRDVRNGAMTQATVAEGAAVTATDRPVIAVYPKLALGANQRATLVFANTGATACQATLAFRDGPRTLASSSVALKVGQVAMLDVAAVAGWAQVTMPSASNACVTTFEVHDAQTGATQIGLRGSFRSF